MRDMLGNEIQKDDVVAYANNVGFMSLALINEVNDEAGTLLVSKRGYRNVATKELYRPCDVIVVTGYALEAADCPDCGRPEEVAFIKGLLNEI